MKYVILILALLVGISSAAHAADPMCEEDCSNYSSDVACDVETGHCIEPYAQCVSRCELGGDAHPQASGEGAQCIATRVTSWENIYRSGRYKVVSLWRCGWGHFLTFSDFFALPGYPRVGPFTGVLNVDATEVCNRDCSNYSYDRRCLADGTCSDAFAECHASCMDPYGGMAEKKLDTEGVQCAPTVAVYLTQEVRHPNCPNPELGCRYNSRAIALWRCGSFHWLSFGEWGGPYWK